MSLRGLIIPVLLTTVMSGAEPVFSQPRKKLITEKSVGMLTIGDEDPQVGKQFFRQENQGYNINDPDVPLTYYTYHNKSECSFHFIPSIGMEYEFDVAYVPGESIAVATDYFTTKEGIRVGMTLEEFFDEVDHGDVTVFKNDNSVANYVIYKGYLFMWTENTAYSTADESLVFELSGLRFNREDKIISMQIRNTDQTW